MQKEKKTTDTSAGVSQNSALGPWTVKGKQTHLDRKGFLVSQRFTAEQAVYTLSPLAMNLLRTSGWSDEFQCL